MTITPYEEVIAVMKDMKQLIETLNTTDVEYFEGADLEKLKGVCNELNKTATDVLDAINV